MPRLGFKAGVPDDNDNVSNVMSYAGMSVTSPDCLFENEDLTNGNVSLRKIIEGKEVNDYNNHVQDMRYDDNKYLGI